MAQKAAMQAINIPEFHGDDISTLKPSEVPVPHPKHDEFLIRITHCSPQHADILHAQGKHQNNTKKGWCHPPFILGYDFAGIIQTLPSKRLPQSHPLKKGDRVFGAKIGAFAQYICANESQIRRVPDSLSSETAVAMSGQAISYASVVQIAKVLPGETVLVSGASGGLGSVCCMVAKALGARVIALVGDEGKARVMRRDLDVDFVLVMEDGWEGKVLEITRGEGVEVFLDHVGVVNEGIRCLAYFGRVVVLGFAGREGVMEVVKMNKVLLKSVSLFGYRFGESARRFPEALEEIWEGFLGMLVSGRVRALVFGKYVGLEDVGRALRDLGERKVFGKIVVEVADVQQVGKL